MKECDKKALDDKYRVTLEAYNHSIEGGKTALEQDAKRRERLLEINEIMQLNWESAGRRLADALADRQLQWEAAKRVRDDHRADMQRDWEQRGGR